MRRFAWILVAQALVASLLVLPVRAGVPIAAVDCSVVRLDAATCERVATVATEKVPDADRVISTQMLPEKQCYGGVCEEYTTLFLANVVYVYSDGRTPVVVQVREGVSSVLHAVLMPSDYAKFLGVSVADPVNGSSSIDANVLLGAGLLLAVIVALYALSTTRIARPKVDAWSSPWARRLGTLSVMSIVALGFSVTPVPALAVTYDDCDFGVSRLAVAHFYRINTSGNQNYDYKSARGETLVRDVRSCSNPASMSTKGKSFVMPANLQGSGTLAQLGYGRVDCPPGGLPCSLPDNQRVFIWTPNDNNGGLVDDVSWYDYGAPVSGSTYRFSIERSFTSQGLWTWTYCITNLSAGTPQDCTTTARGSDVVSEVWYGEEVAQTKDQFGGIQAARAEVKSMKFKRLMDSGWQAVSGEDPACAWAYHSPMSYWICDALSDGNGSVLQGYTQDHP